MQEALSRVLVCFLKVEYQAVNVFNNVILARNRQLRDDDRNMSEHFSKIFNIK